MARKKVVEDVVDHVCVKFSNDEVCGARSGKSKSVPVTTILEWHEDIQVLDFLLVFKFSEIHF